MRFRRSNEWRCEFINPDLMTAPLCTLSFASEDKLWELARRAGGLPDLAAKQALEYAIKSGRGAIDLRLTAEQYKKLTRGR